VNNKGSATHLAKAEGRLDVIRKCQEKIFNLKKYHDSGADTIGVNRLRREHEELMGLEVSVNVATNNN
jgi:hypothetical protein